MMYLVAINDSWNVSVVLTGVVTVERVDTNSIQSYTSIVLDLRSGVKMVGVDTPNKKFRLISNDEWIAERQL